MSIIAISLAGVASIWVSFLAAANLSLPGGLIIPKSQGFAILPWVAWLATRALLLVSRAIPAPILALVALFVLFPGILPGAIALAIHNFGILGRLMAEGIENLDSRPIQALKGLGSPTRTLFLYGILPITLPRFLAYILYRWEVCLRETVIVGLVGAGGLGRLLSEQISSFDYAGVIVTLVCFIVLTVIVDWTSGKVRQQVRG
jgi:phosphonate transport system permease protein